MPRPKGPGAKRYLNVTKQDDVEMRELLWRGRPPTAKEKELNELAARKWQKEFRLKTWKRRRGELREALGAEGDITLSRAKAEARIRRELRKAENKIGQLENEIEHAGKQIKRIQSEIGNVREEFYAWQERAVALIAIHKYLDPEGDNVASPHGSRIMTSELQKELRAEGFHVGARELRRFMRVCGVVGQQGKRTDSASTNEKRAMRDAA
jgi:FtsZ-binding cell division protein ZapB